MVSTSNNIKDHWSISRISEKIATEIGISSKKFGGNQKKLSLEN